MITLGLYESDAICQLEPVRFPPLAMKDILSLCLCVRVSVCAQDGLRLHGLQAAGPADGAEDRRHVCLHPDRHRLQQSGRLRAGERAKILREPRMLHWCSLLVFRKAGRPLTHRLCGLSLRVSSCPPPAWTGTSPTCSSCGATPSTGAFVQPAAAGAAPVKPHRPDCNPGHRWSCSPHFEDEERLRVLVMMSAQELANGISYSGHMYAMTRSGRLLTPAGELLEKFGGMEQVRVETVRGQGSATLKNIQILQISCLCL